MTGKERDDWVIRASALTIGHGRDALFRNLDFRVGRGDIVGLVGPNGCGKTTLLRTLLGLLPPLGGRVERQLGVRVSYVPQRETIDRIVPVSTLEVVLMGPGSHAPALRRARAADRESALQALALLGIERLADSLFRNLSAGQQQRVLLARALATSPDVLVLDEPTAGMDIGGEATMIEFLRGLNRQRRVTILIVTHVLPIALNLATSIMLMSDHAVLQGTIAEVLREDRLTALYGIPVRIGEVDGLRTLVAGRSHRSDV